MVFGIIGFCGFILIGGESFLVDIFKSLGLSAEFGKVVYKRQLLQSQSINQNQRDGIIYNAVSVVEDGAGQANRRVPEAIGVPYPSAPLGYPNFGNPKHNRAYSKFKALLFGSKKSNIKVKESKKSKETTDSNKSKSSKQSNSNSVESGPNARLLREIKEFTSNPPAGCSLKVGKNIRQWIVTIQGAKDTIYEGEEYNLKMIFSKDYPSKPPTVYFLKPCPKHVHVYSNGDICLNLLGRDWRPGMTAESVAISILSMLSSAKEKKIPPDNALHSDNAPGMQQDNWMYHDDKC
eukprot:gene19224-25075_t